MEFKRFSVPLALSCSRGLRSRSSAVVQSRCAVVAIVAGQGPGRGYESMSHEPVSVNDVGRFNNYSF